MLDDLKESESGVFKCDSENHNWTHKSYHWEIPYAKALILPHNINLMHQEQNVVKSIISMCLDVTDFMKDNFNARKDLATLYDRPSLEAKPNARGKLSRPKAPYCYSCCDINGYRFRMAKLEASHPLAAITNSRVVTSGEDAIGHITRLLWHSSKYC
jgi:hypothetical protein